MTDDTNFELTRRKILAGLGGVGLASAGAGLGTSAFLNDTEGFENNTITAGSLDLQVDWEEHYYNGEAPPENGESIESLRLVDSAADVGAGEVGLPDPENPLVAVAREDLDAFMDASTEESGGPTDDPPAGVVNLNDVKPGDFGEVTLSYHLFDNPGYVRLEATVDKDDENGQPEPEAAVDESTGAGNGELGEKVRAALWYDPDCNNVMGSEETVLKRGTLDEVMDFLGASEGSPPLLDPVESGGRRANGTEGKCHAPTTGFSGPPFRCSEKLYMTNTVDDPEQDPPGNEPFGSPQDDSTVLYEVDISGGNGNLTEVFDFTGMDLDDDGVGDYNHVVSMAGSTDGDEIYVIDKFTKRLGVYDVAADSFSDVGEISGAPSGSLQAAVSPDGTMYFTVWGETNLWALDTSTANVTDTISLTDESGDSIEVGGSDIAFTSEGTLYLIDANTPSGTGPILYELEDPSTGNAEQVTEFSTDLGMPGLAVRAAGDENLIASDSKSDQFVEIDPSDGSVVDTYPMKLGGDDFDHVFGDMTVGPLCPEHCVGLAWWVPRDVGNEIQSDTYQFDLTFRTEQCRHNDNPFEAAE
jgi:predicted ribosomally synthesized peptide with SipW-like signal peptide